MYSQQDGKDLIQIDIGVFSMYFDQKNSLIILLFTNFRHNLPEDDEEHGPLADLPDYSYLSIYLLMSYKAEHICE